MKFHLTAVNLLLCIASMAQPVADATADRFNICSGTSVQLMNNSIGAHAFEWKIEGMHYSFAADTVVTLYEPCYDMLPIQLIASDTLSGTSDSDLVIVEVFDSCFFHWTGDYYACAGDTISLGINPEEMATEYIMNPPQLVIAGCLTCPSVSFVLTTNGALVDRTSTYLGGCSEVTSYHYLCTMAAEEREAPVVKVYPNPVSEWLHIESPEPVAVAIENVHGKVVMQNTASAVDCSLLPSGIYIVAICFKSGAVSYRKIIKT